MKPDQVELWTLRVIDAVLKNRAVEDSRVELKRSWPDPRKAADRLAGHANSARGAGILWVIGLDEKNGLTALEFVEPSSWWASVSRFFNGDPPRLLVSLNVRYGEYHSVTALHFDSTLGAPYVVTSAQGSYPQFVVPWREGTGLRAARREDLLRILVPLRTVSGLIDELEFNMAVIRETSVIASLGALFRTEEFYKALSDGLLSSLHTDVKRPVERAYVDMDRANNLIRGALNSSLVTSLRNEQLSAAWHALKSCAKPIETAHTGLLSIH
jgi:hypothetical protein